jgi:signal transduction histidine kinase
MFQLIAQSKRISIEISCPSDVTVFADQNLTKTILRNLVSNAVKFSNINDNILIQAKKINNLINISITDKGIGIPAHNIPKLFRIDQKYSTLGTMNERGTGLGLILCKDFVEKQGGTISVDSKEGEGSVFCFTLPC